MTAKTKSLLVAAFSITVLTAIAQDTQHPGRPGPRAGGADKRPAPPLLAALDANGDHIISADEIANASAALKALDKNGDGKLTPDEYRGARPEGHGSDGADNPRPRRQSQ